MKKMIEIEPLDLTYSVVNVYRSPNEIPRYFQSLGHVHQFLLNSMRYSPYSYLRIANTHELDLYDLVCEDDHKAGYKSNTAGYLSVDFWRATFRKNSKPYLIKDSTGRIITVREILKHNPQPLVRPKKKKEEKRYEYYQRIVDPKLVIRKKNLNKIKFHYGMKKYSSPITNEIDYDLNGPWYRHVHTRNELRYNELHRKEYRNEFQVVRGRRSRKNLPTTWSELSADLYDRRKSWKHNSKRRNQWKLDK